jgi:hypothetical protein
MMTDDELRALVREAIARHLGANSPQSHASAHSSRPAREPAWREHASFGKFLALRNDDTGACMIEPGVQCNHCGFCQTYGH